MIQFDLVSLSHNFLSINRIYKCKFHLFSLLDSCPKRLITTSDKCFGLNLDLPEDCSERKVCSDCAKRSSATHAKNAQMLRTTVMKECRMASTKAYEILSTQRTISLDVRHQKSHTNLEQKKMLDSENWITKVFAPCKRTFALNTIVQHGI